MKYLFSLPEVIESKLEFLSCHLNQDPLESYFGCQRQRGGTSDNPTVKEFFDNTSALRIVDSFCRNTVRGNCRGNTSLEQNSDETPLQKRHRTRL